jgi:hypothetical protein
MNYQAPVTDRAAADITGRTAKAFINMVDWARIYSNAQFIHTLLETISGYGVTFNAITAWTVTTIPTVAEFNILLANIERLRLASNLPAITGFTEIKDDWIAGTAAESPDYVDANLWEFVIDTIYHGVYRATAYGIYCGVATAGQIRFYQHRWREYPDWVPDAGSPTRKARAGIAIAGAGMMRNNKFRRYS